MEYSVIDVSHDSWHFIACYLVILFLLEPVDSAVYELGVRVRSPLSPRGKNQRVILTALFEAHSKSRSINDFDDVINDFIQYKNLTEEQGNKTLAHKIDILRNSYQIALQQKERRTIVRSQKADGNTSTTTTTKENNKFKERHEKYNYVKSDLSHISEDRNDFSELLFPKQSNTSNVPLDERIADEHTDKLIENKQKNQKKDTLPGVRDYRTKLGIKHVSKNKRQKTRKICTV